MYKLRLLTIISLLFFTGPAFAQEYLINDYTIIMEDRDNLVRNPKENHFYSKITINKDAKTQFTAEGWSILLNTKNNKLIAEDITGEGKEDLLVSIWEGGDCCYSYYILELGPEFRVVHKFVSLKDGIELKKLPGASSYSIVIRDTSYYQFYVAGYMSNRPEVIFSYQNGDYQVDLKAMKRPALSPKALEELISKTHSELKEIKNELKKSILEPDNDEYQEIFDHAVMAPVIYKALDLIYSGNADQAFMLVDSTWQAKKITKERFIIDLRRKIAGSIYGKEIIKLNGKALEENGWCG